jgi:hypothetical protein
LRKKFKIPGLAIIILGSAVHGGIKARSLMGIAPARDTVLAGQKMITGMEKIILSTGDFKTTIPE